MQSIVVKGARTHNLKNINVTIPRDKLVVITGLSGSGKSSLAFDTLYAEGQRRYVESLSTYARQFLSMMDKPDVDLIEGLSPAISIEQKSTSHNPRSTVGTVTEIYDYLRLLFARVGKPKCPEHKVQLAAQTISQMVDIILELPENSRWMILAPVVRERKGEYLKLFEQLRLQGFVRVRVNGSVYDLDDIPVLDKKRKHTVEVVVDRFKITGDLDLRLAESLETALKIGQDLAIAAPYDEESGSSEVIFSAKFTCPLCGYGIKELEPRIFSFNSPAGACKTCDGLGTHQVFDPELIVNHELSINEGAIKGWEPRNLYSFHMLKSLADHAGIDMSAPWRNLPQAHKELVLYGSGEEKITFRYANDRGMKYESQHPFEGIIPNLERRYKETESSNIRDDLAKYINIRPCSDCNGERLRLESRHVFINEVNLPYICGLSIEKGLDFFANLKLEGKDVAIAEKVLNEIQQRLSFLVNVGLNYLTLHRSADTLSGGEAQRIRLASQIGSGLVGVLYVLDEPSIGLHQRDNERLLKSLFRIRDLGNTVIVVEHDEDAIRQADYIIDIGPKAGVHGGHIVAEGTTDDIIQSKKSITGQYLSGDRKIAVPERRLTFDKSKKIVIRGANSNNLKKLDVEIPLGLMTCITGISGSGKSTLINQTLYPHAATVLNRATSLQAAECKSIDGLEHLDKVIEIDQSPIGRTPRSNPATYTGLFTPIREMFAATQEARSRGYKPGRFSFNVKGGRCEACEGDGVIKVEMHFLPAVYVPCDVCHGKRYNRETLDIRYKGKSIAEVLEMTIEEGHEFFSAVPAIEVKLSTLIDVGLGYIKLGQRATTLSGGEAQRIKLAKELSRRDTHKTLYILDEPTTGLHFHDIEQLIKVLMKLRDRGNTMIIIEHNLDVIKTADWIVDLGPEGGEGGGIVVACGSPEDVASNSASHTGQFLRKMLHS